MTSHTIELTIYIPTFNRHEKLKNSLDIISKEIRGVEDKVLVYVSNNASPDGTRNYLESLDYPWLHIRHNQENVGSALNMLHCFELPVTTKFVWAMGDDDYLMPHAITGILSLIKEYPEADYIFCNTKAFSEQHSAEVLKNYFESGIVEGGTLKSKKYVGTTLVDFEQLIDPDIADTLLGEVMVSCFRQSAVTLDPNEAIDFHIDRANWEQVDFVTAGKLYQPHNLPFLCSFSGKTKAVYCDVPRTFNFWGSAEWLGDYDYIFSVIILFLISQYKERGFISDEKFIKLLGYYYSIMGDSLARLIDGSSTARPFNPLIKAKMFDFLFTYMREYLKECGGRTFQEYRDKEASHPCCATSGTIQKTGSYTTSIIILSWNQLKHTKTCLNSIRQHTDTPYEIIFVDNGSTDGTLKWLREQTAQDPNCRLIENGSNLGFAKGCNQGMQTANGSQIVLLNNDTVVTPGWLTGMSELLERYPDAGIVGPMTNSASGVQVVEDPGYGTLNELPAWAASFRENNRYRVIRQRRIVGFCMLFRRELAENIGLLDENFGTGNFEDDDYCLRAELAGYRNMIAGDVFVHHEGGATFSGNKVNFANAMMNNHQLFNNKWDPKSMDESTLRRWLVLVAVEEAERCFRKGLVEEAVQILIQQGIKADLSSKAPYIALTEILIASGRFEEALQVLAELPDGVAGLKAEFEAVCYAALGDAVAATEAAERALSVSGKYPRALVILGTLAARRGETGEAEVFFRQAIEADPSSGSGWLSVGMLLWGNGNLEGAYQAVRQAVVVDPLNEEAVKILRDMAERLV
ncbi:MAG TPA: glycosyltransferase [Desulfuromonadales bacterium]|nr:glycosyltransferase [Desulfuromonadales bacterium]